ncbi:MAG TPA: hypothetical protein PKE55_06010 [Kiritimatiellia bacterium]|nr:hypothetical protein [Kiritimatiellia bacterium]
MVVCAKETEDSETILLDAEVTGVISVSAFRARLANGHELVAVNPDATGDAKPSHQIGEAVRVRLSPYDMGQGRIIL